MRVESTMNARIELLGWSDIASAAASTIEKVSIRTWRIKVGLGGSGVVDHQTWWISRRTVGTVPFRSLLLLSAVLSKRSLEGIP
jgi:hypothetical protein